MSALTGPNPSEDSSNQQGLTSETIKDAYQAWSRGQNREMAAPMAPCPSTASCAPACPAAAAAAALFARHRLRAFACVTHTNLCALSASKLPRTRQDNWFDVVCSNKLKEEFKGHEYTQSIYASPEAKLHSHAYPDCGTGQAARWCGMKAAASQAGIDRLLSLLPWRTA